ncbi:MAG: hypothetical protein HFF02_07450 [Erysipelotrichaceae bacterium]|nr:hypothetical protein [Erysipelotrichaceae bacterium]
MMDWTVDYVRLFLFDILYAALMKDDCDIASSFRKKKYLYFHYQSHGFISFKNVCFSF